MELNIAITTVTLLLITAIIDFVFRINKKVSSKELDEIQSDRYLSYRIREALSKNKDILRQGGEIQVDNYIIKQVR